MQATVSPFARNGVNPNDDDDEVVEEKEKKRKKKKKRRDSKRERYKKGDEGRGREGGAAGWRSCGI